MLASDAAIVGYHAGPHATSTLLWSYNDVQAKEPDHSGAAHHHAAADGLEARPQQALPNVRGPGLRAVAQFREQPVAYFETVDHHPDVRIAYGEVTFEFAV